MKRRVILNGMLIALLLIAATGSSAQQKHHEKLWISGKVVGNVKSSVVSLKLVSVTGGGYQDETSSNKYNWFAFSDNGQGHPSNFKLVVYAGNTIVKNVSLANVKSGGRVADIIIP